ncbi:response regulator transcription factor [Eoetvoesiella caeni]
MYLSYRKQQVLSQLLATLAETQTEFDLRSRIADPLLKLLDADYYASYAWEPEQKRFGRCVALNMASDTLDSYETYYRHVDGLTPLMARQRRTTLVNQVMPQTELARTEFFNDFLQRDGLYWGLNLYIWQGQSNLGDVRIWRGKHRPAFDAHEADLLEIIRPALGISLRRARSARAMPVAGDPAPAPQGCANPPSRQTLALECLSGRERQVALLAAQGLSDKTIARNLGIGFTTVRTHLGQAYRKLGISNRVRLAAVLNALSPGDQA